MADPVSKPTWTAFERWVYILRRRSEKPRPSYRKIGLELGLSPQRIAQIYNKEAPYGDRASLEPRAGRPYKSGSRAIQRAPRALTRTARPRCGVWMCDKPQVYGGPFCMRHGVEAFQKQSQ